MKKRIFSLLLSLLFTGTGCGTEAAASPENNAPLDGITMAVDADSVTPEGASFLLLQTTDLDIQYGEHYKLQTLANDTWVDVPPILDSESYAFHDVAYLLPKDMPQTLEVNWSWLYGSLPAGEYRFETDFMDFRGTGDYTDYTLTAEFTVK